MTPKIDNGIEGNKNQKKSHYGGTSTKITAHKDRLCTKAIQRAPRPFESIHNIESGDSFPLSVFGVSDGITNDLENNEGKNTTRKNVSHSQGIS